MWAECFLFFLVVLWWWIIVRMILNRLVSDLRVSLPILCRDINLVVRNRRQIISLWVHPWYLVRIVWIIVVEWWVCWAVIFNEHWYLLDNFYFPNNFYFLNDRDFFHNLYLFHYLNLFNNFFLYDLLHFYDNWNFH